jgi:Arc/MetJ-type ribon-helix-helix transcriptional regulator
MISLRLDEEVERALEELVSDGRSQSEAVRDALLLASRLRRDERLRAEARRVGADPEDRAEMAEVLAFISSS